MIRVMIFDLIGALVQTERLKILSSTKAAIDLCPHELTETEVDVSDHTFVAHAI